MKRLDVTERDGLYVASLVEAQDPVPAHREVLVRVEASGVNRADLSQIAGHYPPPAGESEILGLEVAGTVVPTGERVCALLAGGGHAQWVAVPEGQLFALPRGMDSLEGAAIPEGFLTAFVNLVVEAGLQQGQTLLVHAGASGVGLAAIQIGKILGARVAATTRTASKIPALRQAGADLALHSSVEDFAEAIEHGWGVDAVSVVLDPIGAQTLAGDLRVLAAGGRIVLLATMSGSRTELDIRQVMGKRARLIGSTLRSRSRAEKASLVARFRREVLPAFDRGRLRASVDSVFSPQEAAEAFTRMRDNLNVGKIVIDWSRLRES